MPRGNEDELSGLAGATLVSTGQGDPINLPAVSALDYNEQAILDGNSVDPQTIAWYEAARANYGDMIELRNGQILIAGEQIGDHPVGRYSTRGLDQMRQFRKDPVSGLVTCEFHDGATATVNAECDKSACDCGASFCSHRVAATYVALSLRKADKNDPAELTEFRSAIREYLKDRESAEKLTAAAGWGAQALAATDTKVQFLDPSDVDPTPLPDHHYAKKKPELVRKRMRSAKKLGLPIPDKVSYNWDSTIADTLALCAAAMKSNPNGNGFTMALYGPPSTGKSFVAKILAYENQMPMYEVNFGQNADLEMFLGTQGIEGGDTAIQLGPITKAAAAEGGAVIVINEAVNIHPEQMSLLHDMIGSGGPGEERFITIPAPSGSDAKPVRVKVDEDTIFLLTFNPGKQGKNLPEAVQSRCVMREVDALSPKEETSRLALQVYSSIGGIMSRPTDEGGAGWNYEPNKTVEGDEITLPDGTKQKQQKQLSIPEQIPDLEKECSRAVAAFNKLRQAYINDDLEQYPDMRTMNRFVRTIYLTKHSTNHFGVKDSEIPRLAVDRALSCIMHLGDLSSTPAERKKLITDLIKADYPELGGTARTT